MIVEPAKLSLAVAALIVLAGYAFVLRPMEETIAARYAQADTLRATIERRLSIARRLPELLAERQRLERELARHRLSDSRSRIIDRFLHATARVAQRERVSLQTVAAIVAPTPPGTILDELHLDVTVRGAYQPVLRAIRELNDGDVATQIAVSSLGNAQRRAGESPQLDATLHVTLLRESDAPSTHAPRSV